jgi:hypothetical protein
VRLKGGVEVKICASADNKKNFYYLPYTLQLSVSNGTPQISLMIYNEKGNEKITGGILHFLYQWGLTSAQEEELQRSLATADSSAVLVGPADITFEHNGNVRFEPEAESIAAILNSSMSQSLKIPPTAYGKSAASFQLSAGNATTLWKYFMNPASAKDALLSCSYNYLVTANEGVVRSTVEKQGTVTGLIQNWVQLAKLYDNVKIVK